MTTQVPTILTLYNTDYCLWIETTLNQLRCGRVNEIDISNLIEELEDMGNSQKDTLDSNLRVLLMHLLKYKYQSSKRSNSWLYTIREHRKIILKAFKKSPSLKTYYDSVFDESYQDGRELAADETGLKIDIFPEECPFSQDNVLNPDYLPE
jgi:predicted DNA-binding ribbon-helix-helix protein